jgi:hypothetical protein
MHTHKDEAMLSPRFILLRDTPLPSHSNVSLFHTAGGTGSIMPSEHGIFTSLTATIRHHTFQPRQPTTSRLVSISADPLALHLRGDWDEFPTIMEPRKCIKKSPASLKLSLSKRPCELFNSRCHPSEVFLSRVRNRVGSLKNMKVESTRPMSFLFRVGWIYLASGLTPRSRLPPSFPIEKH